LDGSWCEWSNFNREVVVAKAWTMTEAHKAHAAKNPPSPGYKCGAHAETNGGGCFNCGWKPESAQASR